MIAFLLSTIVALLASLLLAILRIREAFSRGYQLGLSAGSRPRCEACNALADTLDAEGVPLCRLCASMGADQPAASRPRREVFVPDPITGGDHVPVFPEACYPSGRCEHGVSMPAGRGGEQMSTENETMLQRWADHMPERRILADFLDWLIDNKGTGDIRISDILPESFLDEYHGINQRQLEIERRALLDKLKA